MRYVDNNRLKKVSEELNKWFQPILASRSEFNEQVVKEPGRYIAVTPYKDTKSGRVIFVYEDLPQDFLDEIDNEDYLTF